MGAVVGLLLLLLLIGVSHGSETYCDGRKDGAQCYGALGGTVVLRLMDDASEIFRYVWANRSTTILRGTNNKGNITRSNIISNRSVFTPSNGTFRINDLSRNDTGEYKLTTFNSDLKQTGERTLHLSVQAPVSSVLLVSECLQGEMRVSCSSVGGDDPQYSWTLDGRELTDDDLISRNAKSENITLQANVSGYLVCSVRNRFSNVCGFTSNNCTSSNGTQKWVRESNDTVCNEPAPSTTSTVGKETHIVSTTPSTNFTSSNQNETSGRDPWYKNLPLVGGVLAALLILLIVGVAVICSQKKKQSTKPEEEGDEKELTYADVNFMQRPGRQVEQRAALEVEYGQVRFSERPQQTEQRENDCVYSMVRRSR